MPRLQTPLIVNNPRGTQKHQCALSKISEFTVVRFDPCGYGNYRPYTRDYSAPDIYHCDALDTVQVMAALGHCIFPVFGWCEGGVRGIITATLFPEFVQKRMV